MRCTCSAHKPCMIQLVLGTQAGLSEFAFAALWRFWVGIAVGLGVAKLGVSLW